MRPFFVGISRQNTGDFPAIPRTPLSERQDLTVSRLEHRGAFLHAGAAGRHLREGGPPMHHRILTALRSPRHDPPPPLDEVAVNAACRHAGPRWRNCLLTPVAILRWFV